MSRASENEDRRIMAERVSSRCQALIDAGDEEHGVIDVLGAIVEQLSAAAETIESDRRKGWQSAAREYRSAAGILAGWSAEIEAHVLADKPPLRPPLDEIPRHANADLDPADGPISAQIAERIREASTVDAKLDVAFGPLTQTETRLAANPELVERIETAIADPSSLLSRDWPRKTLTHTDPPITATADTQGGGMSLSWDGTIGFSEPGAAPAGQRARMTFAQVRAHGMERARGIDRRSYSQVSSFGECGVRYALSDMDSEPSWWLVGGTALHYACEAVNRDAYTAELWSQCLGRAISETIAESGVTPDRWKAAKKGSEGYDWWRVNGAAMVEAWVTRLRALYAEGWQIAHVDGAEPMIEISLPMMIGDIKVENILDLVLYRSGTDEYLIIDYKSGASAPDGTVQLGQYGHALCEAVGRLRYGDRGVHAAYWMARTDALDVIADIVNVHPWDEIEYVITTMHQAESQGLYLPNQNRGWGGCKNCAVRDLCPVGPR